jgi:hypothetical protein
MLPFLLSHQLLSLVEVLGVDDPCNSQKLVEHHLDFV